MISVSKDSRDRVIAYMEWRQVGQSGFDVENGEYVYVADFWMHDSHKNDWSIYRELIRDVFQKAIKAKWLYFKRRKYCGKQSKNYSRSQIMKLVDRCPMMLVREVS